MSKFTLWATKQMIFIQPSTHGKILGGTPLWTLESSWDGLGRKWPLALTPRWPRRSLVSSTAQQLRVRALKAYRPSSNPAPSLWVNYLTSLCLRSFHHLFYKTEVMLYSLPERIKWDDLGILLAYYLSQLVPHTCSSRGLGITVRQLSTITTPSPKWKWCTSVYEIEMVLKKPSQIVRNREKASLKENKNPLPCGVGAAAKLTGATVVPLRHLVESKGKAIVLPSRLVICQKAFKLTNGFTG